MDWGWIEVEEGKRNGKKGGENVNLSSTVGKFMFYYLSVCFFYHCLLIKLLADFFPLRWVGVSQD